MRWLALALAAALSGCFIGDENDWADRGDIIDAERCGVEDFQPTEIGDAYAAYVPSSVPAARLKEDCIYNDLHRQGLLATR